MGDRLSQVLDALGLGRAVLAKIRQNLGWALGYNVVGIPLAAGEGRGRGEWGGSGERAAGGGGHEHYGAAKPTRTQQLKVPLAGPRLPLLLGESRRVVGVRCGAGIPCMR